MGFFGLSFRIVADLVSAAVGGLMGGLEQLVLVVAMAGPVLLALVLQVGLVVQVGLLIRMVQGLPEGSLVQALGMVAQGEKDFLGCSLDCLSVRIRRKLSGMLLRLHLLLLH